MSLETFLFASAVVFLAFLVRGVTGFGAVLVSLPLLVLRMPAKTAVPLIAILSIVNGLWLTWRVRKHVDRPAGRRLLWGGLPATLAGVALFHSAPDEALRRLLGAAVIGVGLWLLRSPEAASRQPWSGRAGVGAGIVGGLLGGLFGFSGPSAVLYLTSLPLEPAAFRATLLFFLTAVDGVRCSGLVLSGGLPGSLYLAGLGLYPISLLGSWCGERLQTRLSEDAFRKLVGMMLALLGVLLAVR